MINVQSLTNELNEIFNQDFKFLQQTDYVVYFSGDNAYNIYVDIQSGYIFEKSNEAWIYTGVTVEL